MLWVVAGLVVVRRVAVLQADVPAAVTSCMRHCFVLQDVILYEVVLLYDNALCALLV